MSQSPILSVHLGSHLKERWADHCRQQSIKPSTALRQVVVHLLNRKGQHSTVATEVTEQPDHSRNRIEIKITDSELVKIESIAKEAGYSRNMWVAYLVRSHLTKAPQWGMRELEVLAESSSQLLHIGRNLNQIARALNTSLDASDTLKSEDVKQLRDIIESHTKMVAGLISANIHRWRLE
jgi:hypothetical protein